MMAIRPQTRAHSSCPLPPPPPVCLGDQPGKLLNRVILAAGVTLAAATGLLRQVQASNQGFYLVAPIAQFTGSPPVGDNWISLPFRCPWQKAKDLCSARFANAATVTITKLDPSTGILTNFLCSDSAASPDNFLLTDVPRGIRIRNTASSPASISLIGSHEEGKPWPTIYGSYNLNQDPIGRNYLSVPYHTAWTNAEDVCVSLGQTLPSTKLTQTDPVTGIATTHFCGSTGSNFDLVPGEAILILKTSTGNLTGFVPPHQ
jgi:hypothetical protein